VPDDGDEGVDPALAAVMAAAATNNPEEIELDE
jgi:hypothetical protein